MKGIAPQAGWIILGLALLVSFIVDCRNAWLGGSIDLRNRITGVRLMAHDIDPYHYKWREPEPPEYCDPFNNPNLAVSKTTASPTLLLTHLPLAELPYRAAQFAWLALQWLMLLGTAWLWLRHCTVPWQRRILAAFTTGLTYTAAWRLHVERGQSYVLLLFIFAVWLALTLESKRGFVAGLIAGLLCALRVPFLAMAPFLVLHRRDQLLGAAAGFIISVILPMAWEGNCWPAYFSAMNTYTEVYRTDFTPHYQQEYPEKIEGIPLDTIAHFAVIPYADFSIHALLKALDLETNALTGKLIPTWPFLLAILIPYLLWLWFSRTTAPSKLLAGLAAWMFLIDLFLPAYRNNYNDVMILNVVALGLIGAARVPWGIFPCLIAAPVGWFIYAVVPEQNWIINLSTFFYTLGAALFVVSPAALPALRPKRR